MSTTTAPQGVSLTARQWRAMAAIMVSIALAALDIAIANTALPTIAADLHSTPAAAVWIINGYQLAAVATLLPLAALGGIVGPRKIYLAGLALFIVASALCSLADSLGTLVAARILQGLGASAIMSVNTALIGQIFPREQLGRGLGLNSLVVGTAFSAGPAMASLVLSVSDWPWLFAINLPIGLCAIALGWSALPADRERAGEPFDYKTALLNTLTFGALIFALSEAAQMSSTVSVVAGLTVFIIAGAWMLHRERHHPAPMFPLDLLKRPMFALSALTAFCTFSTQGLAFVSLPFFFEHTLGRDPIQTGFLLTPWSVVVAAIGPFAGRLSDRYAPGLLCSIGLAILSTGMLSLLWLPADPSASEIVARMVYCGIGFGLVQSPNLKAIMTSAPKHRSSGASGTVASARLIGQASGAALVALCFGLAGNQGPSLALALGVGFATAGCVASSLRLVARPLDS